MDISELNPTMTEVDDDCVLNRMSVGVGHDVTISTREGVATTPVNRDEDDFFEGLSARISDLRRPLVSPLEHLLENTTRYLPTPVEETQIRHAISEASVRLSEIDRTAVQIQRLLRDLERERANVQEFANKHRVLVAPVWELPPEILSYIFTLALPLSPPSELSRRTLRPALVLAHVNQHWRNVALTTPQLWTTIHIDAPTLQHEPCMPRLLIKRSGDCPLTLHVRHHAPYSEETAELLVSLSPRWEHVALDISVVMMEGLSRIQGHLPSLRSIEIKAALRWTDDTPRAHLGFFSNAPLLRHIAIASPFIPDYRILPWHQLTSYDGPVSVVDIPRIFELGQRLQECFIQPMRMTPGQIFPTEPPEAPAHSTLTSLHLSTGLLYNLFMQVHHLPQFPNLRRLFMYYDKRVITANPAQTLVPLFAKSGAQLEELTFGVSTDASTIRTCLSHTPELKVLQIHRVACDALLKFLTFPPEDETPLLPKLETLRLSGKVYFQARIVIKIIHARWAQSEEDRQHPHKRLKSVAILPPRHDKFEPEARKELLAFNEQDFTVVIKPLDRAAFRNRTPSSYC
ncbi:hypothetical protein NLJ89_g1194 [Agrocybe chaxingu]|uniref:F-box domain-containing protein n=1 Tax=Agrocybe chaxingu TaxID=84603 RepID=A0A9W8TFM9_9AGAR|nr:hypothetical protein NLJ89_g1194 [Agrocybe chaxingu]